MDSLIKNELTKDALQHYYYKVVSGLKNTIIHTVKNQIENAGDPLPGVTILERTIRTEVAKITNINLLLEEFNTKDDIS